MQKRTPSENAKWADRHLNRNPSYFGLCKFEFEEMMMVVSRIRMYIFCEYNVDREIISIPGKIFEFFCAIISVILVFFYVGHFTTQIGRSSVYCTLWKFCKFIIVSLGIWTDDVVELFEIHKLVRDHTCVFDNIFVLERICASNTSPFTEVQTKRTNEEEYLQTSNDVKKYCDSPIDMKGDYAASLYAIVAPRATLLQLVPYGSLLTIFASNMASCPYFVYSKVSLSLSLRLRLMRV